MPLLCKGETFKATVIPRGVMNNVSKTLQKPLLQCGHLGNGTLKTRDSSHNNCVKTPVTQPSLDAFRWVKEGACFGGGELYTAPSSLET